MELIQQSKQETAVIDDFVMQTLEEYERKDSVIKGEIVDYISVAENYNNLDVNGAKVIKESNELVRQIRQEDEHSNIILVAVELSSGDIFFSPYSSTEREGYPGLRSFTRALGIDIKNLDEMKGKEVTVNRVDGQWRINLQNEVNQIDPIVNIYDVLYPVGIGVLIIGLFTAIGWRTGFPTFLMFLIGSFFGVFFSSIIMYISFALKWNKHVPTLVTDYLIEDYSDEIKYEEEDIEVKRGEFRGIRTLADEEDNRWTKLYNTVMVIEVPGRGNVPVHFPISPYSWSQTTAKYFVYSYTWSVMNIEDAYNQLVPVTTTDEGTLIVDHNELEISSMQRKNTVFEEFADSYITEIYDRIGKYMETQSAYTHRS